MSPNEETIAYVTRDIERAAGMKPQGGYFIIANHAPYAENLRKQYPQNVILIESPTGEPLDTPDLLRHEATLRFLGAHKQAGAGAPRLVVFKNFSMIEAIAREEGWKLLNPSAATAETIENKITQLAWLGELAKYAPPHRIETAKDIRWDGEPFIVQWAHGHTGEGTTLIKSEEQLTDLQHKFPERQCRITWYVNGPSFTVNAVVGQDSVAAGNASYQITGLAPFTDNAFSTVGNDWKLAQSLLSPEDRTAIGSMVREIGSRMRLDSWRGLFGLDFMKDTATGKLFLIEINARQPASSTFESHLQDIQRKSGAVGMTTFEAHIAALTGKPLKDPIIEIADGAQIVQRITRDIREVTEETVGSLELSGYEVMTYPNVDDNADLIRIQSESGIMASHGMLNDAGADIRDTIASL